MDLKPLSEQKFLEVCFGTVFLSARGHVLSLLSLLGQRLVLCHHAYMWRDKMCKVGDGC